MENSVGGAAERDRRNGSGDLKMRFYLFIYLYFMKRVSLLKAMGASRYFFE